MRSLNALAEACGSLAWLGLSGCENLTTLPKELCDIPTLKEIDTEDCNIAAPPQAICDEGPDAMRRYWAETAAAAISSR